MDKYQKSYSSEEEYSMRFKIFRDNSAYIRIFNSLGNTWTLGVNQFADMSSSEFKSKYHTNYQVEEATNVDTLDWPFSPDKVDWTAKGKVTPVEDSKTCACTFAFAAKGAVESAYAISTGNLISLSAQQIYDCTVNTCGGAPMNVAFEYIKANGVTSTINYPFNGLCGTCNNTLAAQPIVSIKGYTNVPRNDTDYLKYSVAKTPVAVAVDATEWQYYTGGVLSCSHLLPNPYVNSNALLVGYDTTSQPPFWKVKNSWGTSWGEQGYIRLNIGKWGSNCQITAMPSYPLI